MRIESGLKLDFSNVLIRPKRSTLKSRADVCLEREFTFKYSKIKWRGIPIISANMDTTGTFETAKVLAEKKMITCLHKFYTPDQIQNFFSENKISDYVAITSGNSDKDFEKLKIILEKCPYISILCLDVANGYIENFVDYVKLIRKTFPEKIIIAGNVVSTDMTEALILAGADIVKVGIGGGSVCTTRLQTGCGYPQLSAVMECADASHGLGAHIISDGGCTCPGDIGKAFGGGADFVMLGGILAGHDESGGNLVEREGKMFKEFYGMSSGQAMEKHYGEVAEYRAREGKSILVPYKGKLENTVSEILGGLRSTCTYIGAKRIKEICKRTTFILVSAQVNNIFGKN